ncbi:hypothetical protein AGMMS49944_00960 [Spirochaetia bacterium]|nr:hypothetical protein AGMMS49944_00960 [Spirochaetia bacterium]
MLYLYMDDFGPDYIAKYMLRKEGVKMKKKMFTVWYVLAFSLIITAHATADDQAKAFMDRGITFYYKGDYVTAIADFTDALKLDPNNTATYINRGASYFHKEDYDRAIADCTQAIKLDPNNAKAYYFRLEYIVLRRYKYIANKITFQGIYFEEI